MITKTQKNNLLKYNAIIDVLDLTTVLNLYLFHLEITLWSINGTTE